MRIRWRIGTDDSNINPPFIGWWVDDIRLTDSGSFSTYLVELRRATSASLAR